MAQYTSHIRILALSEVAGWHIVQIENQAARLHRETDYYTDPRWR